MSAPGLKRQLRTLYRTVLMLVTELRHGHVDEGLIAEIDRQMEAGIATHPECIRLRAGVDALRESTLTPRTELIGDTIRAGEKLMDTIQEVQARLD